MRCGMVKINNAVLSCNVKDERAVKKTSICRAVKNQKEVGRTTA